jgi:hypothetical protein
MKVSLSIFGEKAAVPNEEALAEVLKDSVVLWYRIKDHAAAAYGNANEEWKYYSKKAGWSLVIKSGGRTILYLIPLDACFKVNYVFGEKAAADAMTAGLPEQIVTQISEAKVYAEGRSFMVDVRTKEDADIAKKLVDIKNRN